MPIRVECSSCGKKLQVRDELLGKKVKCPVCQTVLVAFAATSAVKVPAPKGGQAKDKVSAKPPTRNSQPPRDDVDDEEIEERPRRSKAGRRKKKAASSSVLWIGIGASVAVVLLALGAYFSFFSSPGSKKSVAVTENNRSKGAARNNDPGRNPRNDLVQVKDLEKYQISLPQGFTDLPVPKDAPQFIKVYVWKGPSAQNNPPAVITVTVITQEQAVDEAQKNVRQFLVNFSAGVTDRSGIKRLSGNLSFPKL